MKNRDTVQPLEKVSNALDYLADLCPTLERDWMTSLTQYIGGVEIQIYFGTEIDKALHKNHEKSSKVY